MIEKKKKSYQEELNEPKQKAKRVFKEYTKECKDYPEYCAFGLTHEVCKNLDTKEAVKICQCQNLKEFREGDLEPDEQKECKEAEIEHKKNINLKILEKKQIEKKKFRSVVGD